MTRIDVNRIQVALHGISAQMAEAAASTLNIEIKRRLTGLSRGDIARLDVGELSLGPVHAEGVLDAAGLRSLIAERLVAAIQSGQSVPEDTGKGGR